MLDYVTPAVQDTVHATNIPAWDIRHNAVVAKATRARRRTVKVVE